MTILEAKQGNIIEECVDVIVKRRKTRRCWEVAVWTGLFTGRQGLSC